MSISGSLADIALVDLLQFVHMSQRTGTLIIDSFRGTAHISFQRGRIASAWSPASLSVVKHLVEHGFLTEEDVASAENQRQSMVPMPSLGQALLDTGVISVTELREAIATKIERTIFDLISWSTGTFQLVADEVRVDDELTFAPGEVLPEIDVDTQSILLEAVRLFDERNRAGSLRTSQTLDVVPGAHEAANPERVLLTTKATRVQLVSKDAAVQSALTTGLAEIARVDLVELRDAGAPAPGEGTPLVVVDRRGDGPEKAALRRIRDLHPRSVMIAIVGGPSEIAEAFAEGAIAVAEPTYLTACCANVLRTRMSGVNECVDGNLHSGLNRLRRALNELRSGLLSATVSLNLMSIVADSVERAVLFIMQRNALVALGAFGATQDRRSLATTTRGLALKIEGETMIVKCLEKGRAISIDYDTEQLPIELKNAIDRPRSGQGVLFPVLGARRAIGIIYADNGRRSSSIRDVELMEVATAQVGLAFENELLRRQLNRVGSADRTTSTQTKDCQQHVKKDSASG